MKVTIKTRTLGSCMLTTEHGSCSYGQPVAVIGDTAYGPGDMWPSPPDDPLAWLPTTIAQVVHAAVTDPQNHQQYLSSHVLVRAFLQLSPYRLEESYYAVRHAAKLKGGRFYPKR